jgi:hypothetical protein
VSVRVAILCGYVDVYRRFRASFCFRRRASHPRKHICIFELGSRCSSVVIMFGLGAGRSGVQIPEEARFSLFQMLTPAVGLTKPPVPCTGVHSRG